jgi:Protein of unknown function (DUF4240)
MPPREILENPMTASPMPADKFWQIVERAGQSDHDRDAHVEALRTALRELTLAEIISFEVAFRRYLDKAYTWDLWGAAHVVHGGCSDDGFAYFRRWLVSRGRDVYEAALADPDVLARLDMRPGPDGVWQFEEIYDVAMQIFKEKGGEGDVRDYCEPEAGLAGLSGEPFEDNRAHVARRYPGLWRRFALKPGPRHHSPLRSMMAQASGDAYTALTTLVAAREHPGSVVIFEGDDGGAVYLTIPMSQVTCDESALKQLLLDIDAMCWSDTRGARVVYEVIPVGAGVAGGMGGGRVVDGLWLHPRLEALGMREDIQQVLNGQRQRIDPAGKHWR